MSYTVPGLVLQAHELRVPLDHAQPRGEKITIFAREVAAPGGEAKPFLVFLQGGPGYEAPRPTGPDSPLFLGRALEDFRVLLLDQRGTGRSSPIGTLPGLTPQEQATHLRHFRADAIVADCEALRAALGSPPWAVLGQSYGGLTLTTYLSQRPEGLSTALFTGGLGPVGLGADTVYAHTWPRVAERARRFFERYPGDRDRLQFLRDRLEGGDEIRLPDGDRLTWRRAAQLGGLLGMSTGAEDLHHVLELPFDSPAFAAEVVAATPFARNPIYAALHEACWADGGATRWAAERTMPADALLTGEHVFGWMFEDYSGLAPLREAAQLLAEHEWPRLYDEDVLRANAVPAAAAIYHDDMYVPREPGLETAALVKGLRPWVTNEYEHNGLRVDGGRILGRLIDLVRGRA